MALSAVRASFTKQTCMKNWITSKTKIFVASPIQVATLKATYGEKYPYSKPWPYETRKFNVLWDILDVKSLSRLNENSKVICVEGNIGVGKNDFAKRLAREFDLKYIPSVIDDQIFCHNFNGVDERMMDPMLSDTAQSYDVKKFLSDPHPERGTVGRLQNGFCQLRFHQYAKAMLHLLNTGQGVVIAGSAHSDDVFAEALRSLNWVTKNYMTYYYDIRDNAYCELVRPHVTIFLDAPVNTCMERIKARKRPSEEKGEKTLSQLLPAIEDQFKNVWLKKQRRDHEVLEIDWSEVGDNMDMDVIAEEMENLGPLECMNADDPMFRNWYKWNEDNICTYRNFYQDMDLMDTFFERYDMWDAPEAEWTSDQILERSNIISRHPLFFYAKGYAREFGHKPEWKW